MEIFVSEITISMAKITSPRSIEYIPSARFGRIKGGGIAGLEAINR